MYLTLVKANTTNFTKKKIARADIARELRRKIGYSGYNTYFELLEVDYFRNYILTVYNVKRALYVYGLGVDGLKEKMTRENPEKHKQYNLLFPGIIPGIFIP